MGKQDVFPLTVGLSLTMFNIVQGFDQQSNKTGNKTRGVGLSRKRKYYVCTDDHL